MPCQSDYMEQTELELKDGRLLLVLDEIRGKRSITPDRWANAGYDKRVYNNGLSQSQRDAITREICEHLRALKTAISDYSLELQIWWRDHQKSDKKREEAERNKATEARLRKSGLSKLTTAEKIALGLGDK